MGRACKDLPSRQGSVGDLMIDTQQATVARCSDSALPPRPAQLHVMAALYFYPHFRIHVLGCQLLKAPPFPFSGHSLGKLLGPGPGSLSISLVKFACKAILKKQFLLVQPGLLQDPRQLGQSEERLQGYSNSPADVRQGVKTSRRGTGDFL